MHAREHWGTSRSSFLVMTRALLGVTMVLAAATAHADSKPAAPTLVALAPPATGDDARKAVAIGPGGEVYEPDGRGAWVRKQRISTGDQISLAGRAGGAVVAFGEGVIYRLAPNGWSAIRLHQKERAVMSSGVRAVAAVGRQLFVLDRSAGGEPMKLAVAPSTVLAIGAGSGQGANANGVLIQTDRGLFRVDGARVVAVKNPPRRVDRIVSDRWVLADDGAIDLKTGRKTGWPPGVVVVVAAATADDRLALVAKQRGKLELVMVKQDKLEREAVEVTAAGSAGGSAIASTPVGVAVDKSGRAVIALDDGTLLVRGEKPAWTATHVTEDLPGPKPGSPPAVSP